jgi:hypothetical protein
MKNIKLSRPTEAFNKNCKYAIFINGKKVTDLKNGEEKIIEISSKDEKADLKAKLNWCGSKSIVLSKLDETANMQVIGNKFLNRRMPLIGSLFPITGILIFSVNNEWMNTIGIVILVLLLLGLIGTLTVWKDKWLKVLPE